MICWKNKGEISRTTNRTDKIIPISHTKLSPPWMRIGSLSLLSLRIFFCGSFLYNMLSQIFPDYLALYEKELKSLRESRQFSDTDTLKYNLGGLEDEVIESGTSTTIVTTTSTISALDEPVKRIRFRADDTGGYTVEFASGWEVTPTIVNVVTEPPSIVVTSANSEFTNYIEVRINNEDFGWTQTGATVITITPDPTAGWGEVEVIINIYE